MRPQDDMVRPSFEVPGPVEQSLFLDLWTVLDHRLSEAGINVDFLNADLMYHFERIEGEDGEVHYQASEKYWQTVVVGYRALRLVACAFRDQGLESSVQPSAFTDMSPEEVAEHFWSRGLNKEIADGCVSYFHEEIEKQFGRREER